MWEEDEFWIELSWRVDADGTLGIRRVFRIAVPTRRKDPLEEYYRWMFENRVPGLPAEAAKEGLEPLAYMRKYGAFLIEKVRTGPEKALPAADLKGAAVDPATR